MHIYFAAAELSPFAKVGGLADVVGSLPKSLETLGINTTVLFPHYADLKLEGETVTPTDEVVDVAIGGRTEHVTISRTTLPGSSVPVLLFGHDGWIGNGGVYAEAPTEAFPSIEPNLPRFALFSAAVAQYVADHAEKDTVFHAHDWHTGIATALLAGGEKTAHVTTLHTIHNLAYQGGYGFDDVRAVLGDELLKKLPAEAILPGNTSTWLNSLLLGILSADWVSTVSPSYRNEILTEEYSEGLQWALTRREDRLVGIVNGIDVDRWDPKADSLIETHYSAEDLSGKVEAKKRIQEELGLPQEPKTHLLGMVTRVAEQKGFDILVPALTTLFADNPNVQFALLGTGDPDTTADLKQLEERYPNQMVFANRFDEALAHRIYAGSDSFFMPSRFEPCGLGQLFAMRYGTPPIARSTGGLKDTVIDGKTGVRFDAYTAEALRDAIDRTLSLYQENPDQWNEMVQNALAVDSSWAASAEQYEQLYRSMLQDR